MTDDQARWEEAFTTRDPTEFSWYQTVPRRSLDLIRATGVRPDQPLIDIGCGTSLLVDALLDRGFTDITLQDISPAALEITRQRLGARAAAIHWAGGDITRLEPGRRYALWHDRAVFHFLVDAEQRRRYVEVLRGALIPGGHVVMATFAWDGPRQCSGLPVCQYNGVSLCAELGEEFELLDIVVERHRTPGGVEQRFAWFRLKYRPGA